MNLSFAGCGFLGIYHVGVAVCFKKYAPHLLLDKISGASAGAIAACCLLCDLPLGTITSNVLKLSKEARKKTLGPFSPSFNVQAILLDSLQKYLPEDAHIRVSGKLHISLTRVYDGKNVIVSQFHSREDLLQALLASSFIPLFSGLLPPRFHGIRYMDGGFSDNLPTLDENTITISPFCGESDICPRDISSQLFHVNFANTSIELSRQNIYRFARILFPPNAEILSNMCKQGFDDALRFLQRNNLINCTRCLAIQSTFVVSETLDESMEYDPECIECKIHRQEALVANLPETVMMIFQDAIDSANRGIINWLFKHRSIKLLSLLSLPYTLPVDVICAILNKILMNVPKLRNNLIEMMEYLIKQICLILPKINIYNQTIRRIITCNVAITNYDPYDSDAFFIKPGTNIDVALQYDNIPSWQESNCIINIKEISLLDNTFENVLQVTSDEEATMTYYHIDEDRIIEKAEIFNKPEKSVNATLSMEQRHTFNEVFCDEPEWLTGHGVTNVINYHNDETFMEKEQIPRYSHLDTAETPADETTLDISSDISIDEPNIFSDPESDWKTTTYELSAGTTTATPTMTSSFPTSPPTNIFFTPDSRPEVDQAIRESF